MNSTECSSHSEMLKTDSWHTFKKLRHKRNLSDDLRVDHSLFPRPAQVLAENALKPDLHEALGHQRSRVQVLDVFGKSKKQIKHSVVKP